MRKLVCTAVYIGHSGVKRSIDTRVSHRYHESNRKNGVWEVTSVSVDQPVYRKARFRSNGYPAAYLLLACARHRPGRPLLRIDLGNS